MGSNVYERCEKYKAFDFVARMRSEGRIRHAGMSFHDTPALLEEILTKYGDRLDFICDYYSYSGEFQDNYMLGDPMEVSEEMLISDVDLGDGNLRQSFRFTDLYQQHYWTPALEN